MPLDKESELFYHVDHNDNVLGQITRKKAHTNKELIHRSVVIILTTPQGQMLFQQRSLTKDTHPGYWTLASTGHVSFGENSNDAAVRELQEELGIKADIKFLDKVLLNLENETEIARVYIGTYNGESIKIDQTEVQTTKLVDVSDLESFVKNNQLSPDALIILKATSFLK